MDGFKTATSFNSKKNSVANSKVASENVEDKPIVTVEDRERFEKVIEEAKNKIVFPENPCLFTAKVKIASRNYKMTQRKQNQGLFNKRNMSV